MTTPATTTPGKCSGTYTEAGKCITPSNRASIIEDVGARCEDQTSQTYCNALVYIQDITSPYPTQESQELAYLGRGILTYNGPFPGVRPFLTTEGGYSNKVMFQCNSMYNPSGGGSCTATYSPDPSAIYLPPPPLDSGITNPTNPVYTYAITPRPCDRVPGESKSCSRLNNQSECGSKNGCTRTPATSTPETKVVKCVRQDGKPATDADCDNSRTKPSCNSATPPSTPPVATPPPSASSCTPGAKRSGNDLGNERRCGERTQTCQSNGTRGEKRYQAYGPDQDTYCVNQKVIYCGASGEAVQRGKVGIVGLQEQRCQCIRNKQIQFNGVPQDNNGSYNGILSENIKQEYSHRFNDHGIDFSIEWLCSRDPSEL